MFLNLPVVLKNFPCPLLKNILIPFWSISPMSEAPAVDLFLSVLMFSTCSLLVMAVATLKKHKVSTYPWFTETYTANTGNCVGKITSWKVIDRPCPQLVPPRILEQKKLNWNVFEIIFCLSRFMWRKHPQFDETRITLISSLWPESVPTHLDADYHPCTMSCALCTLMDFSNEKAGTPEWGVNM